MRLFHCCFLFGSFLGHFVFLTIIVVLVLYLLFLSPDRLMHKCLQRQRFEKHLNWGIVEGTVTDLKVEF